MAYDPIEYQKHKIQPDFKWAAWECLGRKTESRVRWDDEEKKKGAFSRQSEDKIRLRCECGNVKEYWLEDFDLEQKDCGCGAAKITEFPRPKLADGRSHKRARKVLISGMVTPEMAQAIEDTAADRGVSFSQAHRDLIQAGLDLREGNKLA